jgi:hypothetical protein
MYLTLFGIFIETRLLQLLKTYFWILSTLLGITISARLLQLLNVLFSITVMPWGITMDVNLLQLAKQAPPMWLTLLGMFIDDKL